MKSMYDTLGGEYEIAAEVDGVKVGYEMYENEDGAEVRSESLMVLDFPLYDKPPTRKQYEKLAALKADIAAAYRRLDDVLDKIRTVETEGKERLAKLQQHKGLERLEDFLEGRITHFVVGSYGPPKLLTFEQMMTDDSYGPREIRLLALFGRTKGELLWKINRYSDGSGCDTEAIPCTSHEQALDVYRGKIAGHEAEAKELPRVVSGAWIDAARAIGLSMSDWYVKTWEANDAEARAKKIKALKDQLADLGEQ